ncbi:YggS family pyridoxal phosphate-dependent enzyme [bacterium]|nr:YggS family pyridoxal phosphate-dependent enzyme [bacterium]
MSSVKENLQKIQEKIAPYNVKIIAVTKYYNEEKLLEAYEAGIRDFGENRVQDALDKLAKLPDEVKSNSFFHLIGHLQSNKVNKAVGNFDFIHSVDSLRLAEMINKRAEELGIIQKVFLQVNNANEAQKSGFEVEQLKKDFAKIIQMQHIKVEGLMNIAPFGLENDELSHLFNGVKNLQLELKSEYDCEMGELSMGMSGDFEIALKAQATYIRLGRILFN